MTIEKKQQFEDLIDAMMIEEVAGLDSELKTKLQGLPVDKKRIGILSILDKDRGLFMKIHNQINSTDFNKTDHIKNVVNMMRDYVKVGEVEKKTLGEVMTPISLVNDMLDTLPAEVWKNPNLKWLDPCGGCGIFSSVIIERLMTNLDISESDEERYRHIVENMLYVGELQPKNMFLHLCAFDPRDEYSLNVYCGSFLDEGFDNHMKNVWGLDKFDVIVMNPPYQELKEGNKKSQPLWNKFVVKTIDNLVYGGYLVAVHPDGWRNIGTMFSDVRNILRSKQLLFLEVHNTDDGIKTFGANTTYDFYCLHNVQNSMFTKIKCMDGTTQTVDILKMEFIPNGMFKEFEKLLAKDGEEKVQILHSFSDYETRKPHVSKEQNEEFKYPVVYVTYKDGSVNFMYSNTQEKGHFGTPKVIWSNGGATTPIIDGKGDYALTQFSYAIVDEPKNLPFIQKAMLTPEFMKLMSFADGVTGVGRHRYNKKAISLFRKDFWKEFIDE